MDTVSTMPRILSTIESSSFVGRTAELERLLAYARGESPSTGLAVLARPSSGSTELLKQLYDLTFSGQEVVIPFYYCVKSSDSTSLAAAKRFRHEFLTQALAFTVRDPAMVTSSPGLQEISDLAAASGWLQPLFDACLTDDETGDIRSSTRSCLGAPLRTAADGPPVLVIIDEVHNALMLEGGEGFLNDILTTFQGSSVPVVICGHRRFLYGRTNFPALRLESLSFADAGRVTENMAVALGIDINDQTRDLIAVQLGCSPGHISTFVSSAYAAGALLSNYSLTEQFYTDEIFGGRLGRHFDDILERAMPDIDAQAHIIELLKATLDSERHRSLIAQWGEKLGTGTFRKIIDQLYYSEMINLDGPHVTVEGGNILLSDYIEARADIVSGDRSRALVIGSAMARNVKRAPQLMSRFYRKSSSLGLLELMRSFDGRQISSLALDYTRYKNELKGSTREETLRSIREGKPRRRLPKCVFSARTSAYYPQLDEICEPERSATAICITEENGQAETVWIAVEIDSKLEASREAAEFWCDRLEMVAAHCNFNNYQIWLIAPEGFDDEAMAALSSRGGIGSSRAQAEILAELLPSKNVLISKASPEVYEFVVPMGDDTEMIAAHTVEEIARRHDFPAKAINQIKTALVEACINAAEHSLSPDRRIYQTFAVEEGKITITVANRGLRLSDKEQPEPGSDGGRRGWGLKLIRSLMDTVEIGDSDDGTRIKMTKYVRAAARNQAASPSAH